MHPSPRPTRRRIAALGAVLLAACADPAQAPLTAPDLRPAAAALPINSAASSVSVIVTLPDSERDPRARGRALAAQVGATVTHTYRHGLKGFAARMSPVALENLKRAKGLTRIELDAVGQLDGTMAARTWGQDRLDQRALPLNQTYRFTGSGAGVRIYILDSGINPHQEFGSRLLPGYSGVADGTTTDCNGHGTHVAGTTAGATVGVAPRAFIVPIRVAGCDGSVPWSTLIAGLDWMIGQKKANPTVPMVANIRLGGTLRSSLVDAVSRAVDAGIPVAVSAGNKSGDACAQSPANAPKALTVGASTATDAMASFSNFGTCVDLFAPGANILSAYFTGPANYAAMSGTSMAAPHVAGVAALILSVYPTYTANQVRDAMLAGATANVLTSLGANSPNLLLSSLFGPSRLPADTVITPPPPPPSRPPTLTVSRQVTKSSNTARLSWSNVAGTSAEIWRNGARYLTTPNDGAHNDAKLARGRYRYQVCATGGSPCSPVVTVTF